MHTTIAQEGIMLTFLHKLATRLHAPRWVRARLLPTGDVSLVQVENLDLVEILCQDLGVKMRRRRQSDGLARRLVSGMWRWVASDKAVTVTVAFVVVTFVAAAFVAAAFVAAAFVAVTVTVAFVVVTDSKGERSEFFNRTFFLIFFGEMVVLWGASFFLNIPLAWLPVSILSVGWVFGGFMKMVDSEVSEMTKSSEEIVGEEFDRFIKRYRPDITNKDSELNTRIAERNSKIQELRDHVSVLEGEKEAEELRGNKARVCAYEDQIGRASNVITQEEKANVEDERMRSTLLKDFQIVISLKDEAVSVVRLHEHELRTNELIGELQVASQRVQTEKGIVMQRIAHSLVKLNRAMEALGMATLPGMKDGGSLSALYSSAEQVGDIVAEGEALERRLSIVND